MERYYNIETRSEYEAPEIGYYRWLTGMLPGWEETHSRLLWALYLTPFKYVVAMDENRQGDGLALRTRYGWQRGLSPEALDILRYEHRCSVLEVMIALALRCEEEYMTHYEDENPVGQWVGPMIESLGLAGYDDQHWNPMAVEEIIERFLERDYSPDGLGSLFYIPGAEEDLRQVEIWYQMLTWINWKTNGGR